MCGLVLHDLTASDVAALVRAARLLLACEKHLASPALPFSTAVPAALFNYCYCLWEGSELRELRDVFVVTRGQDDFEGDQYSRCVVTPHLLPEGFYDINSGRAIEAALELVRSATPPTVEATTYIFLQNSVPVLNERWSLTGFRANVLPFLQEEREGMAQHTDG